MAFDRGWVLDGLTFHIPSGCGTVHVTVNFQDGKPVEVYVRASASGGCAANNEALGRVVSIALQHGVDAAVLIDQLCMVRCPTAMGNREKTCFLVAGQEGKVHIRSCSDAIGKALQMAMKNINKGE